MSHTKTIFERVEEGSIPDRPVRNLDDLRWWIQKYGYHHLYGLDGCEIATIKKSVIKNILKQIQDNLGLLPDGILGPITCSLLSLPRCGCPDYKKSPHRKGPQFHDECKLELRVYADFSGLKGISPSRAKDIWYAGLKAYEKKVNVAFQMTNVKSNAIIEAHVGPADRGVLAWMEVYDGCSGQHASRYNQDVVWDEELFDATALHENGHGLGVGHSPSDVRSIMGAVADSSIPAVVDVWLMDQLVPRYGQRDMTPSPPNPDKGGNDMTGGIINAIPPEVWQKIFEWIEKLLEECSSETAALEQMRSPSRGSRLVKVYLWRNRRDNNLTKSERNAAAAFALSELADTTEEEKLLYIRMARSSD